MFKKISNNSGSINLELALLIGFIALGVIWSLTMVGGGISDLYMRGVDGGDIVGGESASF